MDFGGIDILSNSTSLFDSSFVPGESSLLSLIFQLLDELLLSPSNLSGQVSEGAELSEGSQFHTSHGIGHILLLGGVVGGGDTLENFKSAQSGGTDGSLVGQHSSNASPEDS